MHCNKEDFIAHGYVLHWCRDTINCSKSKQVVQLLSSFCVLAVCKQIVHIATYFIELHMYACAGTEQQY